MLRAGDAGASLELLSQCRSELRKNVSVLPKEAPAIVPSWRKVKAWVDVPVLQWSSRAALAGFLVLIGFGLGRSNQAEQPIGEQLASSFGPILPAGMRVREVRVADPGQVRVIVEHVHDDELLGPLNDERIRKMILIAVQHASDPAVRMDSLQVLAGQDGSDVRDALLSSLKHDPNAAVRLKAVEALRPFAGDPETRQILRTVLEQDHDAAVRSEAISVLVPPMQTPDISPELLNTLRSVVSSDQPDDYARARAMQVLQQLGSASDSY